MFKVGDKIRRIESERSEYYGYDGQTLTVTAVANGNVLYELLDGSSNSGFAEYFELVEEKQMFDLKTMPWCIVTNTAEEFMKAQEWLFEQGIGWQFHPYDIRNYFDMSHILQNIGDDGKACDYFMHSNTRELNVPEIKLTFKTVVDSVEYPVVEAPESPKDKEIREVREEMQKLADRLKKLEGDA